MDVRLKLNNNHIYSRKSENEFPKKKENFKGVADGVVAALVASDKSPMIGVSIIDLTSMIFPRTIVDATRNGFAATETFLREAAGLIINSLIPSFVVFAMAKLLEKTVMGEKFAKFSPSRFWANEKSNNLLTSAWLGTKNSADKSARTAQYVSSILDNIEVLNGNDKNAWKRIADLPDKEKFYKNITDAILSTDNNSKKALDSAADSLIAQLKASRNIRLVQNPTIKPFSDNIKALSVDTNLKSLITEMNDLGKTFVKLADNEIPAFNKSLTKLVKTKSAAGLAVIVALGASFQYFNRMLTKYRTGSSDFVGEADYVQNLKTDEAKAKKKMCEEERKKLNFHKALGTLGMAALAILSFGKIPTANMFQFNGIFPTMNQCRAISAVTYSGRIISSSNDNELKETAFRDTCTFINLYYLGDYVSKAFATLKEKFGGPEMKGQLLNSKVPLKENANIFQKFWHWFRHTELKGFEELAANPSIKRNRAFAQASGLLYSCIVLGLVVPLYNKHRTNKAAKIREKDAIMENFQRQATRLDKKNLFRGFIPTTNP